ncbi:hypothetical protein BOX15_Mlig034342g2 [Macrostomum lignano]|uniref:Uncharacterized protein n=1 Tax=Macrostomum lignano TaxID=282301 RepID=A0A267E777_9PLAT|nr:hypothetical protein BOX15_Mlig034342g2 [Macrostomum lignano]
MSSVETVTVESLETQEDPSQTDTDSSIMDLRMPIYRTSIVHLTLSGINSLLTLLLLCAKLFTIIFNGVFPSLWYLSFLYTVLRILHICAGATAYTVKDVSIDHLKTRVAWRAPSVESASYSRWAKPSAEDSRPTIT